MSYLARMGYLAIFKINWSFTYERFAYGSMYFCLSIVFFASFDCKTQDTKIDTFV